MNWEFLENPKLRRWLAILFAFLALIFRLQRIAINPPRIGGDGIWQLNFLQRQGSFINVLINLPHAEHGGWLSGDYLLMYPFFKLFGFNKWLIAIPHIAIALLGFYFLYQICQKYFKTLMGDVITYSIVASNWNLVFHSVEIRVYAVLPTLALMAFYYGEKSFEEIGGWSVVQKVKMAIIFLIILWFHAYGIVIILCVLSYLVLSHWREVNFRKNLKSIVIFFAVIGVIAAPLWLISMIGPYHLPMVTTGLDASLKNARTMNTFDYIPNPLVSMAGFVKGVLGNLLGNRKLYIFVPAVIFPFIFPLSKRWLQILFFLTLVVFPLELLLIGVLNQGYWFLQRQFTWVVPFWALSLGWAWDSFALMLFKEKAP